MINWIAKQSEINIAQFDKSMEVYYPESVRFFKDYKEFYRGITELWNYLDAVKKVDWDKYLKHDCTILDLAGGVGWLAAYLSKFDKVKNVYMLDSSKYFLNEMMPGMVGLMGGDMKKIIPIEGIFSPLLFEDNSLDVIVASSSLHHADNLNSMLKEANRVLKKEGLLFILNETPLSYSAYLLTMAKFFMITLRDTLFRRYKVLSNSVSSGGLLCNPYLGDRAYPLWYWLKAVRNTNFSVLELIDTGLLTRKEDRKGIRLTHFICQKI